MTKEGKQKPTLTRREKDAVKYVKLAGLNGLDVHSLAKEFDVSYPAAYSLLKKSEKKGALTFRWEKKGNKGKYYLKDK